MNDAGKIFANAALILARLRSMTGNDSASLWQFVALHPAFIGPFLTKARP